MTDIMRTVRRSAETDKHPCAVCNHTEQEFKDLKAERDTLQAELGRDRIVLSRLEGALADAGTVPTDDIEGGIRALTTQTATQAHTTALREALWNVTVEIAALFPNPDNPLFQNAQAVCSGKNDADALCLIRAMALLNEANSLAQAALRQGEGEK